jgi:DNA gyrase subunit A
VIGINLDDKDRVVGMGLVQENAALLVVTAHGFGKRTALPEYPAKGRGTGGVITIKLRPKDEIAAAHVVYDTSLLTFITTGGTVMRCQVSDISQLGRSTQGVTILNVGKGDRLAALSVEEPEDDEERSQNVLFSVNGDGDGVGK